MWVRIPSTLYGEYQVRKHWICERCSRPYRGRECTHCYCAIIRPKYKPFSRPYPKDGTFEDHQAWDRWHLYSIMMEWVEDPELVYEIGSEELIYRSHQKESYKKMVSASKKKKRVNSPRFICPKCRVRFI